MICTRRGTRQDFPKKVTTLHCAVARGSVRCTVDITNRYLGAGLPDWLFEFFLAAECKLATILGEKLRDH